MKKFLKQFSQILGTPTALLIITAVGTQSAPAATETNTTDSATAAVTARKSVFVDDMKSGKDPFFPKSTRRGEKEPTVITKAAAPVVKLSLKGISGPTNRRFALINNQPLAAGESAFVRIAGGQVKVYCWEIREDSAVVSIEGDPERKELKLREGL